VAEIKATGEYLIDLLGKAVRNEPIRDMAEAIGAFRAAITLATPQQGQEVEAIAKVIAKAYNPGLFDGDETERLRAASPHNVHHAQAVEMTLARKAAQAVIGLPSTPTAAGESQ